MMTSPRQLQMRTKPSKVGGKTYADDSLPTAESIELKRAFRKLPTSMKVFLSLVIFLRNEDGRTVKKAKTSSPLAKWLKTGQAFEHEVALRPARVLMQ